MFEKRYTLLRAQKKRVFEVLRETGMEPAEFSWSREEIAGSLIVSKLSYREGQYFFQFSSYEMNAWCVACPGIYRGMDYGYPKTWDEQEGIFRRWTECLKKELDCPDPWAELAKYRMVLDGELSGDVVNEPIPGAEADQIGQVLMELAERMVQGLSLNGEQAPLVRAKLLFLADAAKRTRSRDWMYMLLGTCASMAVSLGLTEEQAGRVWQAARSELGPFARLLPGVAEPEQSPKRSILGIRSLRRSPAEEACESS